MKDTSIKAFPTTTNAFRNEHNSGMSLRDYFAGQAIVSIMSNNTVLPALAKTHPNVRLETAVAVSAYEIADAMLAERNKE